MSVTRTQKRQLAKLAQKVDRELDNDRRYFERHPERGHYLRRVYPAERENSEIHGRRPPPPGMAVYVVVKKISPVIRMRSFLTMATGLETDLSEEQCAALWEVVKESDPGVGRLEGLLKEAAAKAAAKAGGGLIEYDARSRP